MPFKALDNALKSMGIPQSETPGFNNGKCYSGHEIILLATEIEKSGHIFYKHAATLAKTDELQKVFEKMAEDELEHIRVFNKELAPRFDEFDVYWENDESIAQYLYNLLKPMIFSDRGQFFEKLNSMSLGQILEECLEGERRSIEFYKKLLDNSKCSAGDDTIGGIIKEEKKHLEDLKKLKNEIIK